MHSRRVIGLGGSFGLAAALALACAPAVVAETEAEAHKRLKASQPKIGGEWATKPAHQPKKGKPTKAEKKAAKRARTLGVPAAREPLPAETAQPMFASHVGRRKWESLQGDGYRMQRIHFARSVDGHERRGTIDPWGKVLWEPAGVQGTKASSYKLLDHGDVIQCGDEVLADDTVNWLPLVGWEVGMKWGCNFMPMRRPAGVTAPFAFCDDCTTRAVCKRRATCIDGVKEADRG